MSKNVLDAFSENQMAMPFQEKANYHLGVNVKPFL